MNAIISNLYYCDKFDVSQNQDIRQLGRVLLHLVSKNPINLKEKHMKYVTLDR